MGWFFGGFLFVCRVFVVVVICMLRGFLLVMVFCF